MVSNGGGRTNKKTYQMTAKPSLSLPHVVGTKGRQKPLRLAFGAREGYEGGPYIVGTKTKEETPPSRGWSEGGVWGDDVDEEGEETPPSRNWSEGGI
jgi:hypothetical protein